MHCDDSIGSHGVSRIFPGSPSGLDFLLKALLIPRPRLSVPDHLPLAPHPELVGSQSPIGLDHAAQRHSRHLNESGRLGERSNIAQKSRTTYTLN